MRRPGDRDRGASMVEYAGVIVLAALLVVGIVSTGLPGGISGGVGTAICRIFNGTGCGPETGGGTSPGSDDHGTPRPDGNAPVTVPNVLHSAGSYLASTTAGVGDFFHNLGPNLVKGLRWITPGLDPERIKNDKGPKHGWPGFWHGFWDLGLKPVAQELLGAGKELVDQIVGIGDLVKLGWCGNPAIGHCSKKDTQDVRNTYKYIHDHPGDALKQVGKSIIEPCTKAYGNRDYEQDGRCAASIITTIIGAKGLTKLGKLGKLGKLAGKAGKLGKAGTVLAKEAVERAARARKITRALARGRYEDADNLIDQARNAARTAEQRARRNPTAANKEAARKARQAADTANRRVINQKISDALRSPKTDKKAEGDAGQALRNNLVNFQKKYGPNGRDGEADVETNKSIVEVKSGSGSKAARHIAKDFKDKKLGNQIINPDGKPWIIYAPGLDAAGTARVARSTGVTVVRTTADLKKAIEANGETVK